MYLVLYYFNPFTFINRNRCSAGGHRNLIDNLGSHDTDWDPNYLHESTNESSVTEDEDLTEKHEDETFTSKQNSIPSVRPKKRKRNESGWKNKATKIARNCGKEYDSSSKTQKYKS